MGVDAAYMFVYITHGFIKGSEAKIVAWLFSQLKKNPTRLLKTSAGSFFVGFLVNFVIVSVLVKVA